MKLEPRVPIVEAGRKTGGVNLEPDPSRSAAPEEQVKVLYDEAEKEENMSVIAGEGVTTPADPPVEGERPEPDLFTVDLRLKRLEAAAGLSQHDRLFDENASLRAEVSELQDALYDSQQETAKLRRLLDAERELSAALVKVAQDFARRIDETCKGDRP